MAVMNMVQAINTGLREELARDPQIVLFGEDVGVEGGVFRVTENLQKEFGPKRVFDSPLAESGIVGAAVGMAMNGLRPVVEIQFSGFVYPAMNQIISHVARYRNRSRGVYHMPIVIRMPYGGGVRALEHHSESFESVFAHFPGLKVVIPATPYDAKGLLTSAIRDDDPVIFMEPKKVYRAIKQEVPEKPYEIPLGNARVLTVGDQLTVVAYGAVLREVQRAIKLAKAERPDLAVELIDLRSIFPIDRETVAESVRKTGRLLVVTEGPQTCGVGAELIALVNEEAFLHLEAPPRRLAGFDTVPPLPKGEHHYFHSPERIHHEMLKSLEF